MKVFKRAACLLLCFSLLLCFTAFSVAAETTKTYNFITSVDQINTFRWVDSSTGAFVPITGYSARIGVDDLIIDDTYGVGSNVDPDCILIEIIPNSDFIYTLNPSNYYTFVFRVIRSKSYEAIDGVVMALKDSSGNYAFAEQFSPTSSTGSYDFYNVTFSPDDISHIQNITSIQYQIKFKNYLDGWMPIYIRKSCVVTVSNPTADEITAALKESTDQITGEIQDSTDKITGEIQDSTDEITGEIQEGTDQITDKIDEQTEKQKGFFENLLDGIINGLKALFIPGDVVDPETGEEVSYFSMYFDDWNTWMEDHFGVLYFPFQVFFDLLDKIVNFTPPENPSITFPGLSIMGQSLLKPIHYDFAVIPIPWLQGVHDLYLFAVDAIIGFWLVRLAYKKLQEIMGGGS